jgi:hypothetical protein
MAKRTMMKYVGPPYTTGIRPHGFDHDIRPADFTPAQRQDFVSKYPHLAAWWQEDIPSPTPPRETAELRED